MRLRSYGSAFLLQGDLLFLPPPKRRFASHKQAFRENTLRLPEFLLAARKNYAALTVFLKNKNIRQEYLNSDTCVTDFKRFPRTICDTPTQIKENLGANNNETARHIAEMVSGEDRLKECLRTGMDWGMHQGQEFAKTNTTERADSAQQRSDSIIFRPVSEENIHATITKKSGNLSQIAFYRGQKQY